MISTINAQYQKDLSRSIPLTREQEAVATRDELITANLRYVVEVVAKTMAHIPMLIDDKVSAGNTGLIRAAEKFDPSYGCKFITYARWWIVQAVLKEAAKNTTIRIPMNVVRDMALVRDGYDEELTPYRQTSVELANKAQTCAHLDKPLEHQSGTISSLVPAKAPRQDAEYEKKELRKVMAEFRDACLTPKEAETIRMVFGMDGDREHILKDVGMKLGFTRERARQVKEKALSKLRSPKGNTPRIKAIKETLATY